jgi:DNA (cytosine-5)-methyltransferase 1
VTAAEQAPAASSSPARFTANPDSSSTFYEFFAGGGMAREGLGSGWRCVFANDNDREKAASYAANFGRAGLMVRDVARLTTADLPGHAALVWASFPCPDLSEAGRGEGLAGLRSNTIWPCLELLKALGAEGRAPPLIALENVTGLIERRGESFFDLICETLTGMGYRVGAVVIDAALFVPQSRERVFIVAVDNTISIPTSIIAPSPGMPFHPPSLVAALRRQKAQPIWFRLPIPPQRNAITVDILEGDDRPGVVWDTRSYANAFIASMAPKHLALVEEAKARSISLGARVVKSANRRTRYPGGKKVPGGKKIPTWEVRDDYIAECLRTAGGGSSTQRLIFADGGLVRTRQPTSRECARLMGLSDSYKLPANKIEGYDLIGDGVAVPAVRFLAAHILEPILRATDLGLAAE